MIKNSLNTYVGLQWIWLPLEVQPGQMGRSKIKNSICNFHSNVFETNFQSYEQYFVITWGPTLAFGPSVEKERKKG